MKDPYPMTLGDTPLWEKLLDMAFEVDERMFGILFWYRSVGVVLRPDTKFGYVMKPVIARGQLWGWRDNDEWQQEKQWLIPYAEQVTKLLMELKVKKK